MGKERAQRWRRDNSRVPRNAGPREILALVYGSYAADRLGVKDDTVKQEIRRSALRFSARDYLGFDPATESPPLDIPAECACEMDNERGVRKCHGCGERLRMMTRYAVWQDALIAAYTAERYDVQLGMSFADVMNWLPLMRPYPHFISRNDWNFYDATYAVTHLVYTLNDYSRHRLTPRWLSVEYSFLKRNLVRALAMDDPEMLGEFLDTLQSFGMTKDQPLILKGMRYLLAKQNADGSWGDIGAEDIYNRYHPTWTAIDGLRDYAWRSQRLSFPKLASLLKNSSRSRQSSRERTSP
jgi:hypothetical protein